MDLYGAIAVLAEAAAAKPGPSVVSELLVLCGPLVVIVLFVLVLLNRVQKRYQPLQDRSWEHMDRIESKTDEVVTLLREIRDRLDRRGA